MCITGEYDQPCDTLIASFEQIENFLSGPLYPAGLHIGR